jgi:hypothetical protein
MFSFRRDKMGFFSGIALMAIVGATAISTLVLLILGIVHGSWKEYLVSMKWILGVAWVLCIATVMARVHVFGWQLRRAQRQAEAEKPPEEPGDGRKSPVPEQGGQAEQRDQPHS